MKNLKMYQNNVFNFVYNIMLCIKLYAAALAMIGLGVFLDFYLWDLNTELIFIDSTALDGDRTSFRYLLDNEGYTLHKGFHYSFTLYLGGKNVARERERERGGGRE